jgi:K+-sensing histidine kinase KdpD
MCLAAATVVIAIFGSTPIENLTPLLFLAVIVSVAIYFGSVAGTVGTLTAGFLFAVLLFRPVPSLVVDNLSARSNLIWMVLIGVILSELLGAHYPTSKP